MPKKNLLISAALTAFILVIATSIASAYQRVNASIESINVQATAAAQQVAAVQQVEPVAVVPMPTEEIQVMLTHQEAALVAANFLEQTDLYSVENVVWEEVDAYKVVFSTGDVVYVSMYGDILGTEAPPVTTVVTTKKNNNSNNNNNNNNNTNNNNDDDHHDDEGHDD